MKRRFFNRDGLARRIALGILSAQRRLADWLNFRTAGVSAKAWLFGLVVFCALVGGFCLHLVISAFKNF